MDREHGCLAQSQPFVVAVVICSEIKRGVMKISTFTFVRSELEKITREYVLPEKRKRPVIMTCFMSNLRYSVAVFFLFAAVARWNILFTTIGNALRLHLELLRWVNVL